MADDVELIVPGEAGDTVHAIEADVVDAAKAPAVLIKQSAIAPFSRIEAGFAELATKHAGKTYEIQTVKGRDAAGKDRLALRNVKANIPKVVRAQKAEVKQWAADANAEIDSIAKVLEDRLEEMIAPITVAIDTEDARKQREKEKADRLKAERGERAATTITAINGRIPLAVGQKPAAILEIISVLEAIEGSEEDYGDRNGEVLRAKSETMAKLREMHASAADWEKKQAEALETQRKAVLQSKIDAFGHIVLRVLGKPASVVAQTIADLEAMNITAETYAERASDAIDAQQATLKQLDSLLTDAKAREAAAAQQAENDRKAAEARAESERLERQRAEQEQREQQQAAETQRQEAERAALAQQAEQVAQQAQTVASARTEQIANAIAAIGQAAAGWNASMPSSVLSQALSAMRERKLGVSEFGGRIGVAREAMAAAIAKVEAMLADAINRECIESELEADALPPAAPPAPAEAPAASPAEAAQFFGMFEGGAATATNDPAPAPAPTATPSAEGLFGEMRDALDGLLNIVSRSAGVIGYNEDGTVADWDEFEEVTRAQMASKAAKEAGEPAPF